MIAFSYDIFAAQTAGGVSRCMIELMRALAGADVDWRLWAGRNRNRMLAAALGDTDFAGRTLANKPAAGGLRLAGAWRNERSFALAVRKLDVNIVHRTYYPVVDLVSQRGQRTVETLYDMWDERAGAQRDRLTGLKTWLKHRALDRADVIICISDSTRHEMVDIWPALAARTVVIPLGVRPLSAAPHIVERERPYFVFVGRRNTYKNFAVAVAGLSCAGLPNHDLLCVGGGAFDDVEREMIRGAGMTDRVIQREADDDRLAGLYQSATALLYPSSYEGFGLPLLEAMLHNCPVIAAPLTSLPEVGGDAALYADPARVEDWSAAMALLASDKDRASTMRARGRLRADQFTWTSTAERHAAVYRAL